MKAIAITICALCLFTGCAVRPAVPTRITLTMPDNDGGVEVGFNDAVYTEDRELITVVGRGWLSREHQTHLITWVDSFEPVRSRYFRLTSKAPGAGAERTWLMELVVDRSLPCDGHESDLLGPYDSFTGIFQSPADVSAESLRVAFDNMTLQNTQCPSQTLTVSGRITAEKADPERLQAMNRNFHLAKNFN